MTHIGRYELQRPLGSGRMGTVYLAYDPVLDRRVSIRLFSLLSPGLQPPQSPARVGGDYRALAPLNHPSIVATIEAGEISSQLYIVEEYVDGETLGEMILRKARVPMADKLRWLEELCAAIAYAHREGVLHGHLDPTNVIIDQSGRLRVLGFDIAFLPEAVRASALNPTPGYAAPEQLLGEEGGPRSDLFSIGALAYALLTYTPAFSGDTEEDITGRVVAAELTPLRDVNPDISQALAAIVERTLRKNPGDRFATVEECRDAIVDVRAAEDQPATLETIPAPPLEQVQFTVYRPRAVRPGVWHPMLAFMHLADPPPDAPPDAPSPLEQVHSLADRTLGSQLKRFRDSTTDARHDVPREGEITLVPTIAGIEFNPDRRTFRWVQDVQQEGFLLRAGAELDGQLARGRLSAYLGVVLLAEVDLVIRVDASQTEESANEPPEAVSARAYRNIFASYSHRDLEIVRQFEAFGATLGDRYLRDVRDLRAGEEWSPALLRLIDRADVFQLFWSWNALRSPHVRREWEYALSLKRPTFVRPTYWEDPLPQSAEEGLPPKLLSDLEFQRISLVVAAAHAVAPGDLDDRPTDPPNTRIVLHPVPKVHVDPDEVARVDAAKIEGILARAHRLYDAGDFQLALDACAQALGIDGGQPAALALRAAIEHSARMLAAREQHERQNRQHEEERRRREEERTLREQEAQRREEERRFQEQKARRAAEVEAARNAAMENERHEEERRREMMQRGAAAARASEARRRLEKERRQEEAAVADAAPMSPRPMSAAPKAPALWWIVALLILGAITIALLFM